MSGRAVLFASDAGCVQAWASADGMSPAGVCRLQASGNAVELLGTFEDRSCVYIVMEECRGGDLETLLEVNPCAAQGLAFLHIDHRCLLRHSKPRSNPMAA